MEKGTKTANYNLLKPDGDDFYNIADFNTNADIIDGALKSLADKGVSIENAITSLATVSKTGSYNDLKDKPTKLSQFTNDSGYVVSSSLATISKTGSYNDLKDKPTTISNADTVDGKHASEFYNINPIGISTTTNPTTLTNGIYVVEGSLYVSDGFPVTCWDHATIYVSGYHGVEDNKGYRVIRYVSAWYDVQGEYVKTQIWDSNHWTDWIKVGGNADTIDGKTLAEIQNYNDLSNKPTKLSQFTNDSGYVVNSSLATVSKTGSYNDLKDKPTTISNADTVDGKHASEFYNISPVGISTTTNPTTLTNGIYVVEGSLYVSDGFPVTCWDHATIYVSGQQNEEGKGYRVIRYVSAWYDTRGEYVKTQIWNADSWTDWIKVGDSGNADKLQGYSYQNILDSIKQHRTEIIIRSYDTSSDVKGYSYADYTCTSTNARTVIQNAINNAGKGSVIRLLQGTYKITGGAIEISRDITIVGSGHSTNIIQSDNNNVFKINAGRTTLKDFMLTTSDSNTAKSLLYGNDNNELQDAIFDNIFFIINNSCDNAIASSVIKYCRFKSCRMFRSTTNDYITITFKNGSEDSIINDMFNTGNGYFNIYIESSSDAALMKYSNNHRSRIKIAKGSYTII